MEPTPNRTPSPSLYEQLAHGRRFDKRGEKISIYLASLEAAGPDFIKTAFHCDKAPSPIGPEWYFFYGTLTDPKTLKRILDLDEEPVLRPAKVVGYQLSSWGQDPAMIDGCRKEVSGFAYKVQTTEHEFKLARYLTSAYQLRPCRISFTDGVEPHKVSGRTFMLARDAKTQQAGEFGRVRWELSMGTRLPDSWHTPGNVVMKQVLAKMNIPLPSEQKSE
ncbi:hypothetical protein F5Y17DRAFT_434921 [Xylariaceae sp. FL0594]|nr:hypothetical protein F5Y17DRAFT_434921 [Xylariaceae sp. FL0594]